MSPEAAAEQGFYTRAKDDAALTALLGGGTRIFPGYPSDTLEAADCPRITFYVTGPPPRAKGFQRLRVFADLWIWPDGSAGGRAKLLDVDERLKELFDEMHFTHDDAFRLYAIAGGMRDFPAGAGQPMRRQRQFIIEASPLA